MDNKEPIKDAEVETPKVNKIPGKNPGCICSGCIGKIKCMPRTIKILTAVVGLLLIILLSFAAGAGIALRKARFNCFRGQGMEYNFMGPQMMDRDRGPMGFFHEFEGRDFKSGHGLTGTITTVSDNAVVVKDRDGKDNNVNVTDQTIIRSNRNNLKISDLKANDQVVIMGQPGDNGVVNATLIRVFSSNQNNNQNNQ
jgi:hypothetical protein